MSVELVSPWAALVGLGVALPLAGWLVAESRATRARTVLGLRAPSRGSRAAVPVLLALAVGLLGLAASQPVLASSRSTSFRHDADVFIVLDTSRSMLASSGPGKPTRFERARTIAGRLAASVPSVAVGLASMTDRVLPHVFPTENRADFDATLREALGVERPPPAAPQAGPTLGRATNLVALRDLGVARFFSARATHRVALVLTDGESRAFDPDSVGLALRRAHIESVFVHVWRPRERVWAPGGAAAPDYRPDPRSGALLADLAAHVGGLAFSETDLPAAAAAVEAAVGEGEAETRQRSTTVRQLAPLAAVAALLPLGLVLWRRNLA